MKFPGWSGLVLVFFFLVLTVVYAIVYFWPERWW